jgi:hypothetical protein
MIHKNQAIRNMIFVNLTINLIIRKLIQQNNI